MYFKAPVYLKNLIIHNELEKSGVCAGLRLNESVHVLIVPYVKY